MQTILVSTKNIFHRNVSNIKGMPLKNKDDKLKTAVFTLFSVSSYMFAYRSEKYIYGCNPLSFYTWNFLIFTMN